jgi:hypothetical protein
MKNNIIVKRFHIIDDMAPTDPEDENTPIMNLIVDRYTMWVRDEMKKRAAAKKKGIAVTEPEETMRDRIAENVLHTLGAGPQD